MDSLYNMTSEAAEPRCRISCSLNKEAEATANHQRPLMWGGIEYSHSQDPVHCQLTKNSMV